MANKNNIIKQKLISLIKESLKDYFVCEQNNKIYVEMDNTQVAISLTCPKDKVEQTETSMEQVEDIISRLNL